MKVNYQDRIDLTSAELKIILSRQKRLINRQKIQALYWLKAGYSKGITDVAECLGVHRTTVHRWLKQYSEGGIQKLLEIRSSSGRPRAIPEVVLAAIEEKLTQEPTAFKSYKEISTWIENNYQITVKYQTLHHQIHYRLKAKLKVPRRSRLKKNQSQGRKLKKN
jgi:transposase